MKTYYSLFCREPDGKWYVQFGDYVRSVVAQEAVDTYARDYKARDRKIVKHDDTNEALNAARAALPVEAPAVVKPVKTLLDDPKFEEAALHFADACMYSRRHSEFAQAQLRVFGDHGNQISGCVRAHFPEDRKETLRYLARLCAIASDRAWKARPPRVRNSTMRKLSRLVAKRDGSGFYGPQA